MIYPMNSIKNLPRKTKIVATIGPSVANPEKIVKLIQVGVDVFRLNFSHGTLDEHYAALQTIRKYDFQQREFHAVIGDLPGPKLRVGEIQGGEIEISDGSVIYIISSTRPGSLPVMTVDNVELFAFLKPGDIFFINDGLVRLRVLSNENQTILAKVEKGGVISSRKGINIPYLPNSFSSLTARDLQILETIKDWDLDFLALSFVRGVKDILALRDRIANFPRPFSIIAKIEKPQALNEIEQIIEAADGIMIARGDLGVEVPVESVPFWQKKIIFESRCKCKPVIVATQLLDSMIRNPIPTRAEVSDVAGAIYDGTDAIMLSGETAMGDFPMESVQTASKIAQFTENHADFVSDVQKIMANNTDLSSAISFGAWEIARNLKLPVVVISTYSGSTARRISRFRPNIPILAFSPQFYILRQLKLSFGVIPFSMNLCTESFELIEEMKRLTLDSGFGKKGDKIIITAGVPLQKSGFTNLLQVEEL
ncbi:MAG: pyruvate kinase [Candidatus Atribacteria bacterium]|nr:pyruvate kinase [Candidatus Atribacteria bacterium]